MSDGIGKEFMIKTTYAYLSTSLQRQGFPQPPLECRQESSEAMLRLPEAGLIPPYSTDLRIAIEQRRTLRRYAPDPLSITELTYLLWITQGVKEKVHEKHTLRTVPSAGARHAFETYLLINRVEGVQAGLYHYLALDHALLPLDNDPQIAQSITAACGDQQQILESAVTFIWVAIKERMYWRYGERGYRYLHLDAGHICQNLYLGAESLNCGVCAIAAFEDEDLNKSLNLDGEEKFVVYLASLGKKRA